MQGSGMSPMGIAKKIGRVAAMLATTLLFAAPVSAVTVPGLYSVEVPVSSSQPDDLAQGYADGLSRVFVRVSGSQDVLAQEGAQALLDDAESLLQSYQFLRSEDGNRLQMAFGAVGVNRALASIDAPVWGANRPLILAWIAVEANGSRTLLHQIATPEEKSIWRDAFMKAAENRGLPVALPPASYADRRELMSDIWGQFTGNVRSASETLNHDLISLVRVSRAGSEWRAGWVFDGMELGGAEQSVTASDPQALASAVVGEWASTFAKRYAVDSDDVGESPQVEIVLHGISGFADYAGANRALKNLSPVQSADATGTRNGKVTLRVTFSGEIEQLKRYIALDPRLVPLSEAEVSRLPADPEQNNGGPDGQKPAPSINAAPASQLPGSASTSSPVTVNGTSPIAGTSSNAFYDAEMLMAEEEDAEKAFESLYQVLHYRWQSATSVVSGGAGESRD
ncbi:DUF2066 domain-containing protein [Marinobacter halotolerans]|uniref:DUF2066 domain-containing protein n=1 Tax=Marinobacter halotolerans TaxID=1569211 RepID=UPI001CDA3FC3|nr:DUF2066 domain-containing protein [Marinobacter halotolerans]